MTKLVKVALVGMLVAVLSLPSIAQEANSAVREAERLTIPVQLVNGSEAYAKEGAAAFLEALLEGSYAADLVSRTPMLEQARAIGQLLRHVESLYGRYSSMELIGVLPVSDSFRVVYYALNYERGPVFGVLSMYMTDNGEIITGYAVNTELHKVVPPTLLVSRMQWWGTAD